MTQSRFFSYIVSPVSRLCAALTLSVTLIAAAPHNQTENQTDEQYHESGWVIAGGTRHVGYALAQHLLHEKKSITLFVRNPKKVKKVFTPEEQKHITIVSGDITSDTMRLTGALSDVSEKLKRANSSAAPRLLIGQIFAYGIWEKSLKKTMRTCISAAHKTGAMLVYPGRIYKYGATTPITEESAIKPNSDQGRVLEAIESQLERAAEDSNGTFKTRIIRHSYPYGPGINDGMIGDNFKGARKNKDFKWIGRTDVPFQFTYTPDLAEIIDLYTALPIEAPFDQLNFPGEDLASVDQFGEDLATIAQLLFKMKRSEYSPDCYSKTGLWSLSFFNKNAKRGHDIFYSFDRSIMLDGSKLADLFPEFSPTPRHQAISDTLLWYRSHQ